MDYRCSAVCSPLRTSRRWQTKRTILPYLDGEEGMFLDLVVSLGQAGSAKPREVLQAAVVGANLGHRAIRVALLDEIQQPIFVASTNEGKSWVDAPDFCGFCGLAAVFPPADPPRQPGTRTCYWQRSMLVKYGRRTDASPLCGTRFEPRSARLEYWCSSGEPHKILAQFRIILRIVLRHFQSENNRP